MALTDFTSLDFDQIKTSIKAYLRSNSDFTDFDFEGSNLSVLIDTLAYNTYIASYNANMVSNEVFLDSATLRENVVALARNIGYVPRSRTSARATISFFVDTTGDTPLTVTLKKGVVATTGLFGDRSSVFSIASDVTVPVSNGIATFDNLDIYEGDYLTTNFTVSSLIKNQRFILEDPNIDTSTIRVVVRDSITSSAASKFVKETNILNVDSSSRVFYIQEVEDQRYELIFGDGYFGKKLEEGNYIQVSYIIGNGKEGNGFSSFKFSGRLVNDKGSSVTSGISLITTNNPSQGGEEVESISSIKNFAPRFYASQNRAVTASDYETIIPKIYSEAQTVSTFGGESLDPPQYGKVYIGIKPFYGNFVPDSIKQNIKLDLRNYSVAGIIPEIVDIKYLFIQATLNVYYNGNKVQDPETLSDLVINNIEKYSESTEFNKYGSRFKYSKFQSIIDNSHPAITSNITTLTMRRDSRIALDQTADYEICFGNRIHVKNQEGYNIKSSGFYTDLFSNPVFLTDVPDSDGLTGTIILFSLVSETEPNVISSDVGTIDYIKGEINLNPITITGSLKQSGGVPILQISAIPESNDIVGLQDLYLQLDSSELDISLVEDVIESGSDTSGSIFAPSSSYSNGDLIIR
jgi:hypothetical protein